MHPSTEILCAAWRTGTRRELASAPTLHWEPNGNGDAFGDLYAALMDPKTILVAHNAFFEQCIVRNVFATKYMYSKRLQIQGATGPQRWQCTAAVAAALALPRSLEGAGAALKLPVQKDKAGHRLMLKLSKPKPKKAAQKDGKARYDDPADLQRLVEYCKADVATEVALFLRARPLSDEERRVWLLDQKINFRGFCVDRQLIERVLAMRAAEKQELNKEACALSGGAIASATQRQVLLEWLAERDVWLEDLRAPSVKEALADAALQGPERRMLEIRASISMASTAKYDVYELGTRSDGRLRDAFAYHTASTGRWGGRRIQPQNMPKGDIKNTDCAADVLAEGDLELVRLFYGDPMTAFSSCLRSMIIAPPGAVLDVADYNAIEARVLFWMADHDEGVAAFAEGKDLYKEQAADIFGLPAEAIGDASAERFLGKSAILGCGFQMGGEKFQQTCQNQGQKVSLELALAAVASYRRKHAPVKWMWRNIERAAISAVSNPGSTYSTNHTDWQVRGDFLFCRLPSGRELAYAEPSVVYEMPSWGGEDRLPKLYHWGINAKRKWALQSTYGGRLTENVVQATARDLLAAAMLRIDEAGPWQVVMHVHDEIVAERRLDDARGSLEGFCALMSQVPAWASGCPVVAKGWSAARYRK